MSSTRSRIAVTAIAVLALSAGSAVWAHDSAPIPERPHFDPGAQAERLLRDLNRMEVRCNAARWGAAIGGIMGGTVGAGVADDHPARGAATGALFGALLGGMLGQSIDAADLLCEPPKRSPPVRRYQS
ncbi:MAG: glycine zipper domain-containing protein [Pseudomonadota bacterium]